MLRGISRILNGVVGGVWDSKEEGHVFYARPSSAISGLVVECRSHCGRTALVVLVGLFVVARRAVRRDVAHVGDRLNQPRDTAEHDTTDEATDVRPVSHARAGEVTAGLDDGQELHDEPGEEEPVSPDAHDEHREHEARDVRLRPHQQIAAEDARDGTGSAKHRDGGCRVRGDLRSRGGEATEQVEAEELQATEASFDRFAEREQEDHVAGKVHEAAVQEHVTEDRDHGPLDLVGIAGAEGVEDGGGNQHPLQHGIAGAAAQLDGLPDESRAVRRDKKHRHQRKGEATQVVFEGKHLFLLQFCPRLF